MHVDRGVAGVVAIPAFGGSANGTKRRLASARAGAGSSSVCPNCDRCWPRKVSPSRQSPPLARASDWMTSAVSVPEAKCCKSDIFSDRDGGFAAHEVAVEAHVMPRRHGLIGVKHDSEKRMKRDPEFKLELC